METSFSGVMTQGVYKKDEEFKSNESGIKIERNLWKFLSLMSLHKDYIKRRKISNQKQPRI